MDIVGFHSKVGITTKGEDMSKSQIYYKICEIEERWIAGSSTSDNLFYELLMALKAYFKETDDA